MMKNISTVQLLSLITTPTIIFLIPAISIYVKNQEEFGYSLSSLSLFLIASILCYAVGLLLSLFRLNRLLIYYYIVGLCWFFHRIIHEMITIPSPGDVLLFLILFLLLPGLFLKFYQKQFLSKEIVNSLAVLGFFLLMGNVGYLGLCLKSPSMVETAAADPPEKRTDESPLPNIYHIVFDEFQTDMFEQTLNDYIREELAGFTYFPETICVYGRTEMSLASYMTGKTFDINESQQQYIDMALQDKVETLPMLLKKKGYRLSSYLHRDSFTKYTNKFDSIHYHRDNVPDSFFQQKDIFSISKNMVKNFFPTLWRDIKTGDVAQQPVFNGETGTLRIPELDYVGENGRITKLTVDMSLKQDENDALFTIDNVAPKYVADNGDSDYMSMLQTKPVLAFSLWVYAELPKSVYELILPEFYLEQLDSQAFLPSEDPIISYLSFDNFLKQEKDKDSNGRYVYMHLILPHIPNVLKSDCSYHSDFRSTTGAEQSTCATSLIVQLVQTLKELGRLSDSIIMIHSDHGSSYEIIDNKLVWIVQYSTEKWCHARSRSLLLYKPKGQGLKNNSFFDVNQNTTTLLDVAPTIINAIDPDLVTGFQGTPLLQEPFPFREKRYFHFYEKLDLGWGLTDKIKRYAVDENGGIEFEKDLLLHN